MPTPALIVRSLSAQASLEPHTFTAPFTVGRAPDSDVQIVHPLVSRTHLLITPTPAGWTVSCQGRNGMLVNGSVTREALVTQGTRIQLGDASGPALGLTPVVSGAASYTGAPAQPQPMRPPVRSAPSAPFTASQPSAAPASLRSASDHSRAITGPSHAAGHGISIVSRHLRCFRKSSGITVIELGELGCLPRLTAYAQVLPHHLLGHDRASPRQRPGPG